jgi:glc operon protein GlcG
MLRVMMAALVAALLLSPLGAAAQAPPYGAPIGHDTAMKAIAAAEAEAKKNNWSMVIAVVDSGSRLVAFSRMDNAQLGSIDIAVAKAVTANNLRQATKNLQERIGQGGANLRLLAVPGVMPIDGGVPIVADGKVIGAIGVSGAAADQDGQCAMAGAAAAMAK